MKWLGLVALVVLGVLVWRWLRPAPVAVLHGPIASWIVPDSWTVGTGTYEGKLIITRSNTGLRSVAGNAAFPMQVGIAVAFRNPTDEGLPPREETAELDAIEDAIQARLCAGNESFFAGVVTTGGMREFVLYTSNGDAARRKAEQLVRDFPRHKVMFVLNPDASWNVYRRLLDR